MKQLPQNLYTKNIEQQHSALEAWGKIVKHPDTVVMTNEGNVVHSSIVHPDLITAGKRFAMGSRGLFTERYIQLPKKGERPVYSLKTSRDIGEWEEFQRNFMCESEHYEAVTAKMVEFFEVLMEQEWIFHDPNAEKKRLDAEKRKARLKELKIDRLDEELKEKQMKAKKEAERVETLKRREDMELPDFEADFGEHTDLNLKPQKKA